jgi:hypothetical protein
MPVSQVSIGSPLNFLETEITDDRYGRHFLGGIAVVTYIGKVSFQRHSMMVIVKHIKFTPIARRGNSQIIIDVILCS